MKIFKHRNLALASFSFLVTLFLSYYFNNILRIATLAFTGAAFLFLIIIFAVSRGQHGLGAIIRYTPTIIFVALAMVLSLIFFDNSRLEKYCDEKPHEITATVKDVLYSSAYFSTYEIEVSEIDGEEFSDSLSALIYSAIPADKGAIIKSTGYLHKHRDSNQGFDNKSYYLSKGIVAGFEGDSFSTVGTSKPTIQDYLKAANEFLDSRLSLVDDSLTHSMLSALFLGNKKHLDRSVQRDFSRIGLSHVLALSGMHIAIIVTLFGYALRPFPIHKVWKEVFLIFATLAFIALTGFSESALRAGLMACLAYTLYFFGNRLSLTTSLFYSVTAICIFSPFSIFSLSLQLSFLAMLGCIFSAKIIHSSQHLRHLKRKIPRYIIYSLLTSAIICLFTLPLASISFGQFSLLSPASNLLLGPMFSVLIFLSPVYLIVANIPFASDFVAWLCKSITHACSALGSAMSGCDNIVIPIISTSQLIGVSLTAIFIICMLLFGKKLFPYMKIGCCLGVLTFLCGSIFLFCQREYNSYATVFNFGDNDVLCIEDSGEITVIDVTATSISAASRSSNAASSLGYYEIDNYVVTDYSSTTSEFFQRLSDITIIRRLYLRAPADDEESEEYNLIKAIAKKKEICLLPLGKEIQMKKTKISFAEKAYVPSSSRRAIAVCVECEGAVLTYLSSGAFELYDELIDSAAYISDVIVFGAYGPKYRAPFSYDTPYLDHALFLGDSKDYAEKDFYEKIKAKRSTSIRYKLTP